MDLTRLTTPERISAGSILVVIVAAFLPWVSLLGISARGTDGDGAITLVFGLIGLGVLAYSSKVFRAAKVPGKPSQISLIVLAALVALVGIVDMNGAAAIGLYLTLFAGLAWLAGAIWQMASKPQQAQPGTVE